MASHGLLAAGGVIAMLLGSLLLFEGEGVRVSWAVIIGAVLMAARLNSGSPNYGVGLELSAIAAAVIGGSPLRCSWKPSCRRRRVISGSPRNTAASASSTRHTRA